jgi:hypothetical protein
MSTVEMSVGILDSHAALVEPAQPHYKAEAARRWVCAVTKQTNADAFLVTAYSTDAIKEGVQIWPK